MEEFTVDKSRKDGRFIHCRKCYSEMWAKSERRTQKSRKAEYDAGRREVLRKRVEIIRPPDKFCGGCSRLRPSTDFHRSSTHLDGLAPRCKDCKHKYDVAHNKANSGKHTQRAAAWANRNREKVRGIKSKYAKAHKFELSVIANARREKIKSVGGRITRAQWIEICARYGNVCLRCGVPGKKLTVDHVVSIKNGGSGGADNIQPLCARCNSTKGSKNTDYRIGFKREEAA
jgi:5-methylcytosine-specific restriction endonuclease McrA